MLKLESLCCPEDPLKRRTLKVVGVGIEAEGATIYIAYPAHLRTSGKIRIRCPTLPPLP
jgi:hypothetical protein